MSFRPGPGFPMGHPFGFPQPQGIFINPMIHRGFHTPMTQNDAPVKPTAAPNLFVGNISEKCTNDFIQRMLQECGNVTSWKRIQGSNGKYQAFGFCDFENPEGTLRALRILNDFQIGDKKLRVKAEDKVLSDLKSWALAKRREEGKPELKLKDNELPADEEDMRRDEEVRLKILNWIENDHPELLIVTEDGELSDKERDSKSKKDVKKKDDRKDDRDRRRRSRSRSASRARNDRRRVRSRSTKRKRNRRSFSVSSNSSSSSYSSASSRSRSRSASPKRRRNRSRSSSDSDADERRQLKRELKAKEKKYQNHLKKWEEREKEKSRYYEKMERKEKERKVTILKEAKKMKHFLEDYDDEKDDVKYYKSSCLFQRKRDFERERESDLKDRLKEMAEIEELKQQIMEQNADAAAAEELARKKHKEQEEAAMRRLRGDSGSPNPHQPLGQGDGADDSSSSSGDSDKADENGSTAASPQTELGFISTTAEPEKWTSGELKSSTVQPEFNGIGITTAPVVKTATSAHLKGNLSARLENVFGVDEEEEVDHLRTRKRLKPFEITAEDRMASLTEAEKKKMVKDLINRIPTQQADLFAFPIEWSQVDINLTNLRIRPWVTKKIKEYIGEEENALTDFICEKVVAHTTPEDILKDVAVILDEDAEVFVVKMWRLIIYESESKKLGLDKK